MSRSLLVGAMNKPCNIFSGTKLAQAKNFNDPAHTTNVLVATDAIGMGLNLCE